MTRPTYDDVNEARAIVANLAMRYHHRDNPNLWPDVFAFLRLVNWVDLVTADAKRGAGYGPGGERSPEGGGTVGAQTIGRYGLSRPTEARLNFGTDRHPRLRPELADPFYRTMRDLRAGWSVELYQLVNSWRERGTKAANYPMLTKETG